MIKTFWDLEFFVGESAPVSWENTYFLVKIRLIDPYFYRLLMQVVQIILFDEKSSPYACLKKNIPRKIILEKNPKNIFIATFPGKISWPLILRVCKNTTFSMDSSEIM